MQKTDRNGLTISGRFELIRRLLEMTRKDFGELLGVPTHVIANIEYGKQRISSEIMEALSEEFPHLINYLITGDSEIQFTKEEKSFLKELESYDVNDVKEILNSKPKKRY